MGVNQLSYLMISIYTGIAVILSGVFLNQLVIICIGIFIILLASYGLISDNDD